MNKSLYTGQDFDLADAGHIEEVRLRIPPTPIRTVLYDCNCGLKYRVGNHCGMCNTIFGPVNFEAVLL